MDLFVVNRYQDSSEQVDLSEQENKQLQKLKERIEERKRALNKKSDQVITLKPQQAEPQITVEEVETGDKLDLNNEEVYEENDESLIEKIVKPGKGKPTTEFKVLGISDFEKKTKVYRILPYWLSHPLAISTKLQNLSCVVDEQAWLNKTLKSTLISEGVRHLFPVQEVVIPFILQEHAAPHPFRPHDICVSAPTGSGKTLSFVLPIVQILMNEIGHQVRALIVLPVQELATQVAKVFKKYCTRTGLKVALLSGSTPLQQEQQQIVRYTETAQWVSEVDIIVCTAGRLVEHLQNTEGFSLKHLKFLVIDEADRIMDYIQNDWLYHMDRHIKLENELMTGKATSLNWNNISNQKSPPHKLLFSATLSQDPEKLEQWGLFQPKLFSAVSTNIYEDENQIRKYTTPEELVEQFITCNPEEKPLVLFHFLVDLKWDKVLCFTNAAQSAHRLTTLLNIWAEGKFKAAELSSALDRATRESVLKKFTNGEINILIGTDALARGIDIPDCDFVISYDPPRNIKTYIHRIGRTGRAGRNGQAVTILLQNQEVLFKELINSGGKSDLPQIEINSEIYSNLSKSYMNAIHQTKLLIHEEQSSKVKKSIELKRNSKLKSRKRKHEQT